MLECHLESLMYLLKTHFNSINLFCHKNMSWIYISNQSWFNGFFWYSYIWYTFVEPEINWILFSSMLLNDTRIKSHFLTSVRLRVNLVFLRSCISSVFAGGPHPIYTIFSRRCAGGLWAEHGVSATRDPRHRQKRQPSKIRGPPLPVQRGGNRPSEQRRVRRRRRHGRRQRRQRRAHRVVRPRQVDAQRRLRHFWYQSHRAHQIPRHDKWYKFKFMSRTAIFFFSKVGVS